MTETFETINQWQRQTFPAATPSGVLKHIGEEWEEFQTAPTIDAKIGEAVDLILLLACYIDIVTGCGAWPAVDETMRRNRARDWNIQPDGTGRHVK